MTPTRRTFFQSIAGGITALKAFGKSTVTGSPTGWTITWYPIKSKTCLGVWEAVPETADRNVAFQSMVHRHGWDKSEGRLRVIKMINASQNATVTIDGGLFHQRAAATTSFENMSVLEKHVRGIEKMPDGLK